MKNTYFTCIFDDSEQLFPFPWLSHQTQTSSSQLLSYQLSQLLSEGMSDTMNELVSHIKLPHVLEIKSALLIKILRMKNILTALVAMHPGLLIKTNNLHK